MADPAKEAARRSEPAVHFDLSPIRGAGETAGLRHGRINDDELPRRIGQGEFSLDAADYNCCNLAAKPLNLPGKVSITTPSQNTFGTFSPAAEGARSCG